MSKIWQLSEKKKILWTKLACEFMVISIICITIGILFDGKYPGSDHYFMYKHAEVLLKKGFITTDVLRMHLNMHFMIPQWLFALVFYGFCQILGSFTLGYKALMILVFGTFIGTMMFIAYRESNQNKLAMIFAIFLSLVCIRLFCYNARPFYITDVILLFEAYILKKLMNARQKNKASIKYSYYGMLFLLSILQINLHNSLWIGMILVWLCFIASALWDTFIKKEPIGKNKLKKMILSFVVLIAGAFVNPYGVEYITYIFKSYEGIKPLNIYITEIQPLFLVNVPLFLLVMIESFFVLFVVAKKLELYDLLLYFGFLLLFIMNFRNVVLFYTIGHFGIFHLWKGIPYLEMNETSNKTKWLITVLVCFIAINYISVQTEIHQKNDYFTAIDIIDKDNKKDPNDVTIYSNQMDMGSYAIYKGYKPYIDGCAEIYAKDNNRSYDYINEFVEANKGIKQTKALIRKYKFDYLVLNEDIFHNGSDKKIKNYQLLKKVILSNNYTFYIYKNSYK